MPFVISNMKPDVLNSKRKLRKLKFYHKVNNYTYMQSMLKPWTSLTFSNGHSIYLDFTAFSNLNKNA